jgi:hypothetical protein
MSCCPIDGSGGFGGNDKSDDLVTSDVPVALPKISHWDEAEMKKR